MSSTHVQLPPIDTRTKSSIKMLLIDEDDKQPNISSPSSSPSSSSTSSPSPSPSLNSIAVITPSTTPFSPSEKEQQELKSHLDNVKTHLSSDNESNYAFISHSPSTYPYKQPTIDNIQLARRKRRRTSASELSILEYKFKENPKPSKWAREEIAREVQMSEKAVQIWFQNKRQSCRKNQLKTETQMASVLEIPFLNNNQHNHNALPRPHQTLCEPLQESNKLPPIYNHSPTTPIASPLAKPSTFPIYMDTNNQERKQPLSIPQTLRLSMSCDGKAELIVTKPIKPTPSTPSTTNTTSNIPRTPLTEAPKNSLNRTLSLPEPLKKQTSPLKESGREAECITNLLSLRSGIWN